MLKLANDRAGSATFGRQITPRQLLMALLSYAPGANAVQPGAQYILNMIQPGLGSMLKELLTSLEPESEQPDTATAQRQSGRDSTDQRLPH